MCFSVHIDINLNKLAQEYKANLSPKFKEHSFKANPSGYMKTDILPVLFVHNGQNRIEPMSWSLTPKWAKEYPPKWNTYNARMEREYKGQKQYIYEVPTFKEAFSLNKFCLIPIKSAIEACYWGETSGNIISFGNNENTSFMVAGLYDSWINNQTGEVKNTCTLLTDNPYQYLFDHGHDRSILLLDKKSQLEFITNKKRSIEDSFKFIRNNRVDQNWSYQIERPISKSTILKNTPTKDEIEHIKESVWVK